MDARRTNACFVRVCFENEMKFISIPWDELSCENFIKIVRDTFKIEYVQTLLLFDNLNVAIPRSGFCDIVQDFHSGSKFFISVVDKNDRKPSRVVTAKVRVGNYSFIQCL